METPKNNPVEKMSIKKLALISNFPIMKLIMDKFQPTMPQKYGISHGTLAYWIKKLSNFESKSKAMSKTMN
jgi:hypothetical protein